MSDTYYPIPENPQYTEEIRKLQDSDPASATNTFNPLIEQLIANIHAVKKGMETLPPSAPPTFEIGEDGHLYAIYEEADNED